MLLFVYNTVNFEASCCLFAAGMSQCMHNLISLLSEEETACKSTVYDIFFLDNYCLQLESKSMG